ncbi:MAG: hypothetical protein SFY68_04215 [Candidatus Sumerlaeia bacterium]|nr:hypothetical protein [Candidatus Sumerlaeia bacterium]
MSNVAKIAIGCFVFALVAIIAAVAIIGYFAYGFASNMQQMGKDAERIQALNTQYAFVEPAPGTPPNAQRFEDFFELRDAIHTSVKSNKTVAELMKSMQDPNYVPQIGAGDALGMFATMGEVFKSVADAMEAQQMSLNEYAYYKQQLMELVYYKAINGDPELQKLWNRLESGHPEVPFKVTDWAQNPSQLTGDYASFLNLNKNLIPTAESLEIINRHRDELLNSSEFLIFESVIMLKALEEFQNSYNQASGVPVTNP